MSALYERIPASASVLLALSLILFSGFLLTRLTKRIGLPNVTGFILAGILIGPHTLGLVPESIVQQMSFVSDIALSFIAFSVGKFFRKEILQQTGAGIVVLTLFESLLAGALVSFAMYFVFHLPLSFCLLLGAIATATAPASTMQTISQYQAKGDFVHKLLEVVALDDVVCLLAFSVAAAFVSGSSEGHIEWMTLLTPILNNLIGILLGAVFGVLLGRLLRPATRSRDNRLILAIAMLLGLSGLCGVLGISPLLACMVFGTVYINLTDDEGLFQLVSGFSPPIMSIFFIVSGMNLDLGVLKSVGLIGVGYFIIRIAGKYGGAWLGAKVTGMDTNVQNYLGLALIPQAGVAIGLAFLGDRMLPPDVGNLLLTIILATSVLYELIGPACAKLSLKLSGAIGGTSSPAPAPTPVSSNTNQ